MQFKNRLLKEIKDAQTSKGHETIDLSCINDDMLAWQAKIKGPEDSPFATGTFVVRIQVPREYPLVAPTASFSTKVFHPNVHFSSGEICLDILKTDWTPAWTLMGVCRAIQTLLAHPEASSPLNCDAGNLLRNADTAAYNALAKYYAVEHAGAKIDA